MLWANLACKHVCVVSTVLLGAIASGCANLPDRSQTSLAEQDAGSVVELPPVSRAPLNAGDAFIFDGGRLAQVMTVDADLIKWTDGEQTWQSTPHFYMPPVLERRGDRIVRRQFEGSHAQLWPLTPGGRADFVETRESFDRQTRQTSRVQRQWRCRVQGARLVSVPAGHFDAQRVLCSVSRINESTVLREFAWDYAPALNHIVQRQMLDPLTGRQTNKQLEASLPGKFATPARLRAALQRLQ